jgi:plasmid stabilization system protein ParE
VKKYRVVIEPPALTHIEQYHTLAANASGKLVADRWFNRLRSAILSLARMPTRVGAVPEQADFAEPLRQLVFTQRYRVIFAIRGDTAHVLCVRGLGLPPLQVDDMEASGRKIGMP